MKIRKMLMIALLGIFSVAAFGQAKKPTLMVMPSDAWCNEHGYMQTYDNQGTQEKVPDYKAAVSTDKQLNAVISKINNLMADRGFPLKDLQQTLKTLNNDAAEDALLTSKAGNSVAESPLDRLRRRAKPDIIMEIDWTENKMGPKSSITYNLRALDAYSDKKWLVLRVQARDLFLPNFQFCSKRLYKITWMNFASVCNLILRI